MPVAENLLQQDFTAQQPNQEWVADITYIGTDEGWLYLAVVLDLFSRKVVGWSMSDRMTAALVCDARMAVFAREQPRGVIVHSDRGSQYCSREHRALLAAAPRTRPHAPSSSRTLLRLLREVHRRLFRKAFSSSSRVSSRLSRAVSDCCNR